MAHIQVNAFVNKQEVEIDLDRFQWISLTVNGQPVDKNDSGFSKTIPLTQGVSVPFSAKVKSVEIVHKEENKFGVNGPNYEGYWLTIEYKYANADRSITELYGTIEYVNGFVHGAQNQYGFTQGMLTGSYNRVE